MAEGKPEGADRRRRGACFSGVPQMTRRSEVEDRSAEVAGEVSGNNGGLDVAAAAICAGLRR